MAEETALTRKIDVRLRSMRDRVNALAWYAERYGSTGDGWVDPDTDLLALQYEWCDTLDRFSWLHERFLADELSQEQAAKHRRNLMLLADRIPILRQLGLTLPSGDLLAALGSVAAAQAEAEPA